jgi:hypothetical protein
MHTNVTNTNDVCISISVQCIMIMSSHIVYTYYFDKFHIQWCLYPMLDLRNIIHDWMNEKVKSPLKYHVTFNDMKRTNICHSFNSKIKPFSVPKVIHCNKLNKEAPGDYKKCMWWKILQLKNEHFVKGRISYWKLRNLYTNVH